MGTLPVGKLLMKMSVPVILSMLVSTLYSIVDSVFVSRLGESALTAMSLATPISSLIACTTVGFSVGMNAEMSKKLGEGDLTGANHAAGNGLLVNWICAAVFLVFGLFFTDDYYRLQTADPIIQQLGFDYTSVVCMFCFGVANQTMLERMLIGTGRPLGSVFSLLAGTIINLILDPILIFGYFGAPAMGMRGAAIATVLAQTTAALVALGFNLKVNEELQFGLGMFKPRARTLGHIWNVGFPAALQQSISPIMIFGMNQILLAFTAAAPAVYVIYVRLQSIVLIPTWGLKNTVVSIISYNYGAGFKERIRKTIRICVIATLIIGFVGLLLFQSFPNQLLSLFNAQGDVLTIGRTALHVVSFVFPFSGITLLLGAFFQALGHSKMTLVTSLAQLCIMLASALVLSRIGTVYTVWYAFVITEVIVAAVSVCFMTRVSRHTLGQMSEASLKTVCAA